MHSDEAKSVMRALLNHGPLGVTHDGTFVSAKGPVPVPFQAAEAREAALDGLVAVRRSSRGDAPNLTLVFAITALGRAAMGDEGKIRHKSRYSRYSRRAMYGHSLSKASLAKRVKDEPVSEGRRMPSNPRRITDPELMLRQIHYVGSEGLQ